MTVARIDQVIPSLASRDAIGGHVVQLRDLLRSRGYQSDIYYGNATADRLDDGFPVSRLGDRSSTGRVLLYQLSIGSGVADIFRERGRAEVRQLPQHHPGRSARGVGPGGGRGGPLGPGPAPRPGAGHRVRHRRLDLQRAGAPGGRLPVDHDGPAAHRPGRFRRFARPGPGRPPGRPEGDAGAPICCSWGRSLPTRASTTWSRRSPPTAGSTTRRPGSTWWAGPSATSTRRPSSGSPRSWTSLDAVEIAGSVTHEELIAYYGGRRRLRLPLQPRRVLRSPPRGHVPPAARSWPTPTPRSPRRWRVPA